MKNKKYNLNSWREDQIKPTFAIPNCLHEYGDGWPTLYIHLQSTM